MTGNKTDLYECRELYIPIEAILEWCMQGGGELRDEIIALAARTCDVDLDSWEEEGGEVRLTWDQHVFRVCFTRTP